MDGGLDDNNLLNTGKQCRRCPKNEYLYLFICLTLLFLKTTVQI